MDNREKEAVQTRTCRGWPAAALRELCPDGVEAKEHPVGRSGASGDRWGRQGSRVKTAAWRRGGSPSSRAAGHAVPSSSDRRLRRGGRAKSEVGAARRRSRSSPVGAEESGRRVVRPTQPAGARGGAEVLAEARRPPKQRERRRGQEQ